MRVKSKKVVTRILWCIGILILLMNLMALFHAYSFTHFDSSKSKTPNPQKLSFVKKVRLAVFGVDNPRPTGSSTPDTVYNTVKISSNKLIEAWHVKSQNSIGTAILFHGYGGEKSSLLDRAEVFRSLGYSTLLVDFMGSGGSEGNETTIGFKEAVQVKSCFDYIQASGEENIILFGTSLGAAAIMKAQGDYQLPATSIILECPFGTMIQTVKARFSSLGAPSFPMAHLLVFWGGVLNGFNGFSHNPIDYAKNIKTPTLLFYGAKDDRVSQDETKGIFEALSGRKELVTFPEAGHENYLTRYRTQWTEKVALFLQNGTAHNIGFASACSPHLMSYLR